MTTCLGKSCSFGLPCVSFVNCCLFMYLVISLLVLRTGYGVRLYQFLIIAYFLLWTEYVNLGTALQAITHIFTINKRIFSNQTINHGIITNTYILNNKETLHTFVLNFKLQNNIFRYCYVFITFQTSDNHMH